jgi:uncharacterized membrane protein
MFRIHHLTSPTFEHLGMGFMFFGWTLKKGNYNMLGLGGIHIIKGGDNKVLML